MGDIYFVNLHSVYQQVIKCISIDIKPCVNVFQLNHLFECELAVSQVYLSIKLAGNHTIGMQ